MVRHVVKPEKAKKENPSNLNDLAGFRRLYRDRSDWIRTSGLLVPKARGGRFLFIYKGFKRFPARFRAGIPLFQAVIRHFKHYAALAVEKITAGRLLSGEQDG